MPRQAATGSSTTTERSTTTASDDQILTGNGAAAGSSTSTTSDFELPSRLGSPTPLYNLEPVPFESAQMGPGLVAVISIAVLLAVVALILCWKVKNFFILFKVMIHELEYFNRG